MCPSRTWTSWSGRPSFGVELTFRNAARIAFLSRGVIIGNGANKPGEPGDRHKDDAVGVRINELPITSERLFAAMKEKQKK